MPRHRVIIDCDPGQDDAVAILLALASPEEIELLAITAVAGNVPLALTQRNARQVVELTKRRDVPIFAGCSHPILGKLKTAEEVHGATGLNGVILPEPRLPLEQRHAVDAIIDIVMASADGSPVTLCPIGPLTNIALAMLKEPALASRLDKIVLMGGAIGLGNSTASAEFNFYVDPEAAAIVFASGVPIIMFGLDVTHRVLTTPERLQRIAAIGTDLAKAVCGFLEFFNRHDIKRYGIPGAPLHDPCTIAWLLDAHIFSGKECRVDIETTSPLCRGRSVVDWWGKSGLRPNALVIDRADADRFFDLLIDRLSRL